MGPITQELYKQIKGWRIYSVIVPAVFTAGSAFMYLHYGTQWEIIFYSGIIVLSMSCITWWHWSLSTMVTMLAIMKDTDDHFSKVSNQLEELHVQVTGRPHLSIVKTIDNPK